MTEDLQAEIAMCFRLPAAGLQQRYQALTGKPARSTHPAFLARRLAWALQEQQVGGLPDEARQRIAELAESLDPLAKAATKARRRSPTDPHGRSNRRGGRPGHRRREIRLPGPGATIRRTYKGCEIAVRILDDGFEFDGHHYRSLTAIAKLVTGAHWNGLLFFGLIKQQRKDLHDQASSTTTP
jgi:hypothetical protein